MLLINNYIEQDKAPKLLTTLGLLHFIKDYL